MCIGSNALLNSDFILGSKRLYRNSAVFGTAPTGVVADCFSLFHSVFSLCCVHLRAAVANPKYSKYNLYSTCYLGISVCRYYY